MEVKRLKEREKESSRPKKLVAEQALDIEILKKVDRGNFVVTRYGGYGEISLPPQESN